jgi:hypothetical protein
MRNQTSPCLPGQDLLLGFCPVIVIAVAVEDVFCVFNSVTITFDTFCAIESYFELSYPVFRFPSL